MNKYEKRIQELLEQHGTSLRSRKHKKFRLDDGQKFVMSSTPSSQDAPKRALSELRRRLSHSYEASASAPATPASIPAEVQQQQRFRVPNNPPRECGEFHLPPTKEEGTRIRSRSDDSFEIETIAEILMAADSSPEFWKLDHAGKTRTLAALAQQFVEIEVLPVQFIKASNEEIRNHFSLYDDSGRESRNIEDIIRLQGQLSFRTLDEWGFTGIPSFLVHDPILGPALIDTSAWTLLENTDYIFLRHGELHGTSHGIASQVWNANDPTTPQTTDEEPDHFIYSTFISKGMMERKNFRLIVTPGWTDLAVSRKARLEITDIIRSNQGRLAHS